jgi:hypothetical protein
MPPRRGARLRAALVAVAVGGSLVVAAPWAPSASATAPPGTPAVVDGAVTALARMGHDVVVGGSFTKLRLPNGRLLVRRYLFAYDFATGRLDRSFHPVLNGPVDALAATPSAVYLGGTFTKVGGLTRLRLAKVTATGAVVPRFRADASAQVSSVALNGSRLYVGGTFHQLGGVHQDLLAQVDTGTGKVNPAFDLPITGVAALGGYADVKALVVSPNHRRLLVAHTGAQVAGQDRYGLAVIDIGSSVATLSPWYTNLWKSHLVARHGIVHVTTAAWGPDSRWFVVANSGGDHPPTNDSVQRFDLTAKGPDGPTWVTRQFDSSYAIAVDSRGVVYVGGHFHYTEAPGSVEPWPGNSKINYGYSSPLGGAWVLGSQVVERAKIDALRPATGKAVNWWSSVDGPHGPTAFLIWGHKLIVGDDGEHVDGQALGRQGMAELYQPRFPKTAPHTTIADPVMGANLQVGAVAVHGSAYAPGGVSRVTVQIRKRDADVYWHPQGFWGKPYSFDATLADGGNVRSAWTLRGIVLPDAGFFTVFARTHGGGQTERQPQFAPFALNAVPD